MKYPIMMNLCNDVGIKQNLQCGLHESHEGEPDKFFELAITDTPYGIIVMVGWAALQKESMFPPT